ncbi:MAG: hypothetical protein C4519_03345 [Desulfobacteraceae bacterium]|nr:MAG: hypothetical protein C4519_03345 [Desulfobacteraceae bacterium]
MMPVINRLSAQLLVGILIGVVTLLHFIPLPGQLGAHFLHRELFFFPLMLAAFWFGFKGGLFVALAISIAYALYFALHIGHQPDLMATVVFQVLVFFAVGLMLGWLVDRQEKRRRERDFIKDTFGKYVPEELREEILNERIPLAGEIREVTVLFADLRDFTSLVEKRPPQIVVQMINRYFKEMSGAIRRHGGLVLQFIGDEIEAVFGAPLSLENHPVKAVDAALEMRHCLTLVNRELVAQGLEPLRHGIGIHTGKVLAGHIGSPELSSYAMVGKTVNLAARIQDLNKRFNSDILLSAETRRSLGDSIPMAKEPPVRVRGVGNPVELYRLL